MSCTKPVFFCQIDKRIDKRVSDGKAGRGSLLAEQPPCALLTELVANPKALDDRGVEYHGREVYG
jgi:hypothetical protein